MGSVLLDLRTGDPVIKDGNYVRVSDNYGFYQVLDGLLHCQVGSEILNPMYGFDLKLAIQMNSLGSPTEMFESILADALNPQNEALIKTVDMIRAWREGQELKMRFSVTSVLGVTATVTEELQNVV